MHVPATRLKCFHRSRRQQQQNHGDAKTAHRCQMPTLVRTACTCSATGRPEVQLTLELIQSRWPQLGDIAAKGTLVAWPRPDTYVERRAADGYQEPELVLIVGTAHVSTESATDVTRVIEAVQPDAVVVELCRSRSAVMSEPSGQDAQINSTASLQSSDSDGEASNTSTVDRMGTHSSYSSQSSGGTIHNNHSTQSSHSRSGSKQSRFGHTRGGPAAATTLGMLEAVKRSTQLGGQTGLLLLQLLLAGLTRRAAASLGEGVQPGVEFLAARRAAERVDAQLVLGDTPVEITLQRAWDALTSKQQTQLCWQLISAYIFKASSQPVSMDLVERVKRNEDDALSQLMAAMASQYPSLMGPLVHERDKYLAWSLKRSKAVNGAKVVVGVMGAGHVRGVLQELAADNGGDSLRFGDLVGNLNSRREQRARLLKAAGRFGIEVALAGAAFAAWEYWAPTLIQ